MLLHIRQDAVCRLHDQDPEFFPAHTEILFQSNLFLPGQMIVILLKLRMSLIGKQDPVPLADINRDFIIHFVEPLYKITVIKINPDQLFPRQITEIVQPSKQRYLPVTEQVHLGILIVKAKDHITV